MFNHAACISISESDRPYLTASFYGLRHVHCAIDLEPAIEMHRLVKHCLHGYGPGARALDVVEGSPEIAVNRKVDTHDPSLEILPDDLFSNISSFRFTISSFAYRIKITWALDCSATYVEYIDYRPVGTT